VTPRRMTHALVFAFRTLLGPWVVAVVLPLEVLNYLQRGMPWRGEALWTVDWFPIPFFVVGPLLAGAAAVDAARLTRPGAIHLVLSTGHPVRPFLRAALWTAVPAMVCHAAVVVVALLAGGASVSGGQAGWLLLALVTQLAALLWYTALGSAIGRLAPPLLAGMTAAAVSWLLFYPLGMPGEAGFQPLNLGGATISRLGLAYNPAWLLTQLAFFVVLAALLLWLPVRSRSGYRVPTGAGAVLIAALVVVLAVTPRVPVTERLLADPVPPDRCAGAAPEVCLYSEHRDVHDAVHADIARLVDGARATGYEALIPPRLEQSSRTYRSADPGTRVLPITADGYRENGIRDLVHALSAPLHCDALYAVEAPPEEYWQRLDRLQATWWHMIGVRYGRGPQAPVPFSPAEAEQVHAQFQDCDLEGR
jgi:hypothetical protein